MLNQITHIVHTMMTSLKDVRAVQEIHFIGNMAVRFRLDNKVFDVRGHYPLFSVHEIEGSCMSGSKAAYEIERQLNGGPIAVQGEEDFAHDSHEEAVNDLLCAHVDSMDEEHVRAYNEECGGPDLDPINAQRVWLKTHLIHRSAELSRMFEEVLFMEGKERYEQLRKSIKAVYDNKSKVA